MSSRPRTEPDAPHPGISARRLSVLDGAGAAEALVRAGAVTTPEAELDVRPGGRSLIVMQGPDGRRMSNAGSYLDVVPDRKLVFTDAFVGDWAPRDGPPFMVATVTFEPEDGATRYLARVQHWTTEARTQHEAMGFETGWGICADQLAALAATLG